MFIYVLNLSALKELTMILINGRNLSKLEKFSKSQNLLIITVLI